MAKDHDGEERDWADVGFSLFLLAVCGVFLWGARSIRPPVYDTLGSAALPVAAAGLVGALSLWTLLRALRPRSDRGKAAAGAPGRNRTDLGVAFLALLVAYVLALSTIRGGFVPLSMAFLVASGLLLARRGGRIGAGVIALAVALSLGGGYAFTRFFYIALP